MGCTALCAGRIRQPSLTRWLDWKMFSNPSPVMDRALEPPTPALLTKEASFRSGPSQAVSAAA